jgi:glycosyltransferase involved in cell wall biosynthesis
MPPVVPKVLIVAENASSKFGGEAFLPLKYFQILKRRGYAAKLITHARNQSDLDVFLSEYRDDIQYVPDTIWHRAAWRFGSVFPSKIRDVLTEIAMKMAGFVPQSHLIRALIRKGEVNLIHQPTPVSPRSPSAMHRFGLPLLIGPMNGGMRYPDGYEDYEDALTRNFVRTFRKLSVAVNWLIPGKRRAHTLLVANRRTQDALPLSHRNVVELVENGVDLSTWQAPATRLIRTDSAAPFRLVFMGRLVDWKAVDVTLCALRQARATGVDVRLDILGDGSARAALETLSAELNLQDAVMFHGFLPQTECAARLAQADALILNSIFECGGAVVLEAMSMGLPVIAADWGGPADYLDSSCGILVPPTPRADFANRLSLAILRMAGDPVLCQRMGQAGAAKIAWEYDWEKKVDHLILLYQQALQRCQT